ncbi:hypothetical protein WOSG25_010840 [Weissella oryzae SG25]|uniref:DUF2508 family protein n=1 Tax=Weissella oryzae (strain DSM 25784 / JCM 18191 / LMG 30913 / SG25) TaxID=1329250 RepID=A0A069CRK4_WEIOS|nr:DUF2508 family protein [Weissella oryzae]GAK29997.1 hypothetical protein WOSG25_010840 [Weissella oryzae SG25]
MGLFSLNKPKGHSELKTIPDDLVNLIELKKEDLAKARISEKAMLEGDVDPRMIKAQTNIIKQKYFFLLRAAREQGVSGNLQRAFESSNRY